MPFVADDLGAWLIALLADAGRKKLTRLVFGTEQERALQHVARSAIWSTAEELRPESGVQVEELAMVVSEVFHSSMPEVQPSSKSTLLETLQAGIAGQLAPLNDQALTGTGESSAEALDVPVAVLEQKLTGHLVRQIVDAGRRGGPLAPLADQLNHDMTHLQGLRVEGKVDRLTEGLLEVVARLDGIRTLPEIALSDDSDCAPSLTISPQEQKKPLSHARESLKQEKIILEFENGANLIYQLLALLEDYYAEVVRGNLSGFAFSSSQIVPEWGSEYRLARELYTQYLGREGLQLRRLEQDLVEGVRILLDITFIREKQTLFSLLAISSFTRLIRHRSIRLIRSQLPEELDVFKSFHGFSGDPLSSNWQAAQFYGCDVRLVDLWDPKDPRHVLKLWLPRDGYAGSWFSQGFGGLPPDDYISHYHPPEHYGHVLPQAVARFLSNGDPIPTNFNEYMIGLA